MDVILLWVLCLVMVSVAMAVGAMLPVVLRTRDLLLELLQSIVGKVEGREPFIHGMGPPPDEPPDSAMLAETVADAERQDLTNGTFRGGPVWEPPPSDETKP